MTVNFDGTRVDAAEVLDNWTNWGATATQEPDYFYQGSFCISCQVKTAEVGQYLTDPAGTVDYTNPKIVLFKIIQTNYTAIDGNGLQLYIGNDDTNYWRYEIFNAVTYPPLGGFQIVPIDPTIKVYKTETIGTPDITAIDFYGIQSDANAQAKAPNLGIDAVDFVLYGQGLTMTGLNQSFDDFIDFDEGIITNRYGVVSTKEGIIYVNAILNIGTGTLTTFSDTNKTLVFPDGRFGDGFSGLNIGLQNASNDMALTSCTLIGRGTEPSAAQRRDTRPIFTVEGNNGVLLIDACSIQNFNYFIFNSAVTLQDTSVVGPELLIMSGATIQRDVFDSPTVSSGQSFLECDDLEKISYTDFISDGDGHAILLTVSGDGNLNFIGNTFSEYASADGSTGNEAIYNDSGGNITINLQETASIPSIRNGIGSNTSVQLSVTLTLSGIVSGSEVRIQTARGANPSGAELFHVETTTGADVEWTYNFSDFGAGYFIDIIIHNVEYTHLRIDDIELSDANSTIPIQQQFDRWYANPDVTKTKTWGLRPTDDYQTMIDTYIDTVNTTTNYGTSQDLEGFFANSYILVNPKIANGIIPSFSNIISANLYFYIHTIFSDVNFRSFYCKRDWVEIEATWNIYSTGNNWQTAGADGANDIGAADGPDNTTSITGWLAVDVSPSLQDFVDGTITDFNGWKIEQVLLAGDATCRSSEYIADTSLRPYLEVTWIQ